MTVASFWQNDRTVWEEGIQEAHAVVKDDRRRAHKRTGRVKFFPTGLRITTIQVAKGSVYDPKLVPDLPAEK